MKKQKTPEEQQRQDDLEKEIRQNLISEGKIREEVQKEDLKTP